VWFHSGSRYNNLRKIHFTGATVLRLKDGEIAEEIGLDDEGLHSGNLA
jgi:hypothetical protein